jgi:cation diffusion facilitator family transporter
MTKHTEQEQRYQDIRYVTIVGAILNVILAAAKIVFGWLGQSQALIADGLHSFSDLISDGVVLFAAKHSRHHADDQHPYGHARFETAATVAVGALLIFVALEFISDAAKSLWNPTELTQPTQVALIVTLISIATKEALYQYTMIFARRLNSSMLKANAWHHRSDSISSVIVLIGVIGAMQGVLWLDIVAAIIVGLMIAHIGIQLVKQGFVELVDTGLETEKLAAIREIIHNTPGVKELHELRTRRMGDNALIDVHILVDERISVSEGHQISEAVRARLMKNISEVANVLVHIDPEDDANGPLNAKLPLRDQVSAELQALWREIPAAAHIRYINLHYLGGSIRVDICLPLEVINDTAAAYALADQFSQLSTSLGYVKEVNVYYVTTDALN